MRNIWRAGRIDFLSGARAARLCAVVALAAATCASGARAAPPPKVDVVAFGLWGEQSVFASEAASAARVVARQYGHGGKVVVRANTRLRGEATEENLRATLASLGAAMDPEREILFLILSSHGDQQGIGVATPREESFITPIELREMLRESGARLSVVVVSACYSGIFAQALAAPDTLVITAADADHASFGCRDGAKWTTFGEAFFGEALARTKTLPEAFALARSRIAAREQAEGYDPSNPQMAGGAHVLERLPGVP
ncbi:MAG TPA: C13 family peptidase [Roseiarcus sp.]|nr:C13 family peptidase [Roseiarcus sp.]